MKMKGPKPVPFWDRVAKTNTCWLWTGCLRRGYGSWWDGGQQRNRPAHVVAYEEMVGPVPAGKCLDHKCRNRACVRPTHLRPLTLEENILAGDGVTAVNARKIVCINGHPLTGDNVRPKLAPSGKMGRRCVACTRSG